MKICWPPVNVQYISAINRDKYEMGKCRQHKIREVKD